MIKAMWENARIAFDWLHAETRHSADNFMRDMRSLRALWNYIYLALYIFLCVWTALYFGKEHLGTAIVTTGGIVGTIFTAYVWSTTKEKQIGMKKVSPISKPEPPHEDEKEVSD